MLCAVRVERECLLHREKGEKSVSAKRSVNEVLFVGWRLFLRERE